MKEDHEEEAELERSVEVEDSMGRTSLGKTSLGRGRALGESKTF